MTQPVWLPYRGSTLLHGRPQSYQSFVAADLGFGMARAGSVVFLTDTVQEGGVLLDQMLAWRGARNLRIGERLRVHSVVMPSDPLLLAMNIATTARHPVLIIRDRSTEMAAVEPTDPWFRDASELAKVFACPCLTVSHDPAVGDLDLTALPAGTEVWNCATYHHARTQSNMAVRLHRQAPLSADVIELVGSQHGRTVVWDDANEEPPDDDPDGIPLAMEKAA